MALNEKVADIDEIEEWLKNIAEASGDFIWEMDTEFRYTYASEGVSRVLKRPLKEILGKTPFDFMLPEDVKHRKEYILEAAGEEKKEYAFEDRFVLPDWEITREHIAKAVRNGRKKDVLEDRFVLPDGKIIWMETRAAAIFNDKGEVAKFRGTAEDVTRKKSLWLEFERQCEFADMVAEVSTNFVGASVDNLDDKIDDMLSRTGKFFTAASSYFFQLSADGKKVENVFECLTEGTSPMRGAIQYSLFSEISGWEKKIIGSEIVHTLDVEKFPEKASREKRAFREQGIKSLVAIPTIVDESTVGFFCFTLFKESKEWDEKNIHLQVLENVFSDALKKVRAEEQVRIEKERAEEASRAKSDFLSVVSHELRTPLTSMREGLSVVLEGLTGTLNAKQEKYLSMVDRNARRLSRLIGNVLDIQKLQYDKVEMDLKENNINNIVEETAGMYKKKADSRGLKLKIIYDEKIPPFKFDADRITQVLVNLLDNAMKFTEEGGIAVKTRLGGGNKVVIAVSDTGRGLDGMDIKKIYDKFEQGSSAKCNSSGGTGLGLSIAKEIIKKHGGSIDVRKHPEKGVTFFFSLPFNKAAYELPEKMRPQREIDDTAGGAS